MYLKKDKIAMIWLNILPFSLVGYCCTANACDKLEKL